jgi:predicted NACHT family NTPase
MTKRSLQASSEGIKKAQAALINRSLTQQYLANALLITRQPVSKFFQGKLVDRRIFLEICEYLDLDWVDITSVRSLWDTDNTASISEIDNLVQEIREKIKPSILKRCGIMRVLDMTQPMQLNDIYTDVNIIEKITGQRWIGNELLQETNFERFGLSRITEERVPALKAVEKYSKLMILGKAGSGKTTFLKYLAIQCINGEFQSCMVPIFVNLKDFAEVDNQHLPDINTDLEALQLNSEAILKSLEVQHSLLIERAKGIYSFSHITFHEYFVAQKVVSSSFTQTEEVFQNVLNYITDKRWREIFLLTAEMLPNADYFLLLMKHKIESLSAVDDKLWMLLKDCLNSDCYVSREVRKEIEDAF